MIGIGIDTGGTYTDAVVYDLETREVLCAGKALTTKSQLEIGIAAALDTLDPEAVGKAELLSLSTTLATNACVEDKGSRAKLLLIGVDEESRERLKDVYASYGFQDLSQLVFLDGRPEKIYANPREPDWEELKRRIPEEFAECSAAGVVQIYPRANGGRFEKQARKLLEEELGIPVTIAYEMFDEADVLKRGAGTLLNARLIPLIDEFLQAVKNVCRERKLELPITIVRSDGSMMSETLARECPVETLLSGPAASAVGGSVLAGEADAMIVDMGGTTTDIALVRKNCPVMADTGIYVGKWKTMVKGMDVDTFVLGGDCALRFQEGRLFLDNRRVIPLSLLASEHPEVTGKLRRLAGKRRTHTRMLHEFYVLQKDISGDSRYTEEERKLCKALLEGPLMAEELAGKLGTEIYFLATDRLEEEGVLMKSGLTPTDLMVVKGDFPIYAPDAALAAMEFLALNTEISPEELPDRGYDLVEKKLYCNIVRVLLRQKYPKKFRELGEKGIAEFIEWSYEDAKNGGEGEWMAASVAAKLPIVGVGAPIHIFLPRVAKLLGTRAVIRQNAPVANALGAIAGQVVTRISVHVKAEYKGALLAGYSVLEDTRTRMFETYDEAEQFAVETGKKQALARAGRQGASSPELQVQIKKIRNDAAGASIFFESNVEVTAAGSFQAAAAGQNGKAPEP
ncbi:MAG: hydantoinase/oxoprolinase family protein [Candidatus Limivivens sp.]|nr:hydantoinase/oxoprolinase family protein [Candidatus Limivivens sp.]